MHENPTRSQEQFGAWNHSHARISEDCKSETARESIGVYRSIYSWHSNKARAKSAAAGTSLIDPTPPKSPNAWVSKIPIRLQHANFRGQASQTRRVRYSTSPGRPGAVCTYVQQLFIVSNNSFQFLPTVRIHESHKFDNLHMYIVAYSL
jgi:hypothetical protein